MSFAFNFQVEPAWFRHLRDAYWAHTLRVRDLEFRIASTYAGQAWLNRVRGKGFSDA